MCGRFAMFSPPAKLKDLFVTDNLPNFPSRYNCAPMQELPIVISHRMGFGRWGFLPPWLQQDDKSVAAKMINARSETVAEKPSFKQSWEKKRRCLIPANGFYEWKKLDDGKGKQPFYIFHEHEVICFAGLWSKVNDIVSFTILTKPASKSVSELHHRMPVAFRPVQAQSWFSADLNQARELIEKENIIDFQSYPVDSKVGKVANDSEDLIKEITARS